MLRAALAAAFALLVTSCVHERSREPDHPAVTATAAFIIQAIAPNESGEEYRWEAVTVRVANLMQWRSPQSGAALEAGVRREGRLSAGGSPLGVVATGDHTYVTALSIDTNAFHAVALLEALRRAGTEVSFQGDYETYSEYVITPAGRDFALLTTNSTCSPLESRPVGPCRNYVTLTFNPF